MVQPRPQHPCVKLKYRRWRAPLTAWVVGSGSDTHAASCSEPEGPWEEHSIGLRAVKVAALDAPFLGSV